MDIYILKPEDGAELKDVVKCMTNKAEAKWILVDGIEKNGRRKRTH